MIIPMQTLCTGRVNIMTLQGVLLGLLLPLLLLLNNKHFYAKLVGDLIPTATGFWWASSLFHRESERNHLNAIWFNHFLCVFCCRFFLQRFRNQSPCNKCEMFCFKAFWNERISSSWFPCCQRMLFKVYDSVFARHFGGFAVKIWKLLFCFFRCHSVVEAVVVHVTAFIGVNWNLARISNKFACKMEFCIGTFFAECHFRSQFKSLSLLRA